MSFGPDQNGRRVSLRTSCPLASATMAGNTSFYMSTRLLPTDFGLSCSGTPNCFAPCRRGRSGSSFPSTCGTQHLYQSAIHQELSEPLLAGHARRTALVL